MCLAMTWRMNLSLVEYHVAENHWYSLYKMSAAQEHEALLMGMSRTQVELTALRRHQIWQCSLA